MLRTSHSVVLRIGFLAQAQHPYSNCKSRHLPSLEIRLTPILLVHLCRRRVYIVGKESMISHSVFRFFDQSFCSRRTYRSQLILTLGMDLVLVLLLVIGVVKCMSIHI